MDKIQQITTEHHTNPLGGPRGLNQTVKRIKTQFDWDNINDDVNQYVNKCQSCQINRINNQNVKQPMVISPTSTEPFEKLFIHTDDTRQLNKMSYRYSHGKP